MSRCRRRSPDDRGRGAIIATDPIKKTADFGDAEVWVASRSSLLSDSTKPFFPNAAISAVFSPLDVDPLNLIERQFFVHSIIQLGSARRFVAGDAPVG